MHIWQTTEKPLAELVADELHPKFCAKVEVFYSPSKTVYIISNNEGKYLKQYPDDSRLCNVIWSGGNTNDFY